MVRNWKKLRHNILYFQKRGVAEERSDKNKGYEIKRKRERFTKMENATTLKKRVTIKLTRFLLSY